MQPDHLTLLVLSGFPAGAMNSLAGGGYFVSLPALIATGVPSVQANASSTVALYPGGLAGTWAYRDGLAPVGGVPLKWLGLVTAVGGLTGALLLLWTPSRTFDIVVPWLMLLAFGKQLGEVRLTRAISESGCARRPSS